MGPLDCPVCWNRYDLDRYRPRSITCGHTLCSECVNRTIRGRNLCCPICRKNNDRPVNSSSDLPVNFTVQEMLQAEQQQAPTVPINENVVISDLEKSKLEFSDSLVAHLMNFDAHIGQIKNVLSVAEVKKNAIKEKMEPLMVQLQEIQREESELHGLLNAGNQHRSEYDQVNESIEGCSTDTELRRIQNHVENVHNRVKAWVERTKFYVPIEIENPIPPPANMVINGNVNVQTLKHFAQSRPSGIWCVLNRAEDGVDSYACVSICRGVLVLNRLRSTPPTVDSSVPLIPYADVRKLVNDSRATTFLEISVPGHHESKLICIELEGIADRTTQFRLLCSGEMGVSYTNTSLIRKMQAGNAIIAGTRDDGLVNTLPGLLSGERPAYENQTLVTPGLVCGMQDTTTEPTQFCIYGKHAFGHKEMRPMGRVVFGLDTIQHLYDDVEDLTSVRIIDCGLVISLN